MGQQCFREYVELAATLPGAPLQLEPFRVRMSPLDSMKSAWDVVTDGAAAVVPGTRIIRSPPHRNSGARSELRGSRRDIVRNRMMN